MNEGPLRGRGALVTGASSGIGAAVARALSAGGARVALASRREGALLEVQAGLGGESLVFPVDVTDGGRVRSLVERTEEELSPVDILVNCAGVMYYTLMKNLREDEWERTVEVNCKGALNCVAAVLPGMLERGRGHILTISSDAGRKVFPGLAVYSASKFFVEALSQGLRLETAGTGVSRSPRSSRATWRPTSLHSARTGRRWRLTGSRAGRGCSTRKTLRLRYCTPWRSPSTWP